MRLTGWVGWALLGLSGLAIANNAVATPGELQLARASLNGILAFQDLQTSNTYSGEVSWNPAYGLGEAFDLTANVGVAPLKSSFASNFFAFDAELLARWKALENWSLAVGGGGAYWVSNGGFFPAASADISRGVSIWKADRIHVSYTAVLLANNLTHQARIGLGFSF